MTWMVAHVQDVARMTGLGAVQVPALRLAASTAISNEHQQGIGARGPSGPILVVEYPLVPEQYFVIDGNHRVARAASLGESVEVVFLSEGQMVQSLSHDRFRNYYAIHRNLTYLMTYEAKGGDTPPWIPLSARDGLEAPWL